MTTTPPARTATDTDELVARRRTTRLALLVTAVFALALAIWIVPDPGGFAHSLGLGETVPATGWALAALVVVAYTAYTLWAVPAIRPVAIEISWFRALAVPLAVGSGLIEEMFFRHVLMSAGDAAGMPVLLQVAVSAVIFAAVHTVWVLFGRSWQAVLPILLSTFGLGVLMALVYLASDRIVLPAVLAHGAINLVIEPGLLLSSARLAAAPRKLHRP